MKATDLKVGQRVIVTPFSMKEPQMIVAINQSAEMYGYIIFTLKESSSVIKIPYSKQLDYWGEYPILI